MSYSEASALSPHPPEVMSFCRAVGEMAPGATFSYEGPSEGNYWWVQVRASGKLVEVEWRPKLGFGISDPDNVPVYGEGVDEVFRDANLAARRVTQMLNRVSTRATSWLRQLREVREISQVDLAARLKVNQAAVSKLENRDDMKLTTLLSAVEAMGGRVEVVAHFKECDIPLRLPRLHGATNGDDED